jgi:hypothetical protein
MQHAPRSALVFAYCCVACSLAAGQEPPAKFGTTVVIPAGLRGQIYHIKKGSMGLPDFRKGKPVGTIYTTTLNVPTQSFDQGFPGVTRRYEWFAIRYTGRIWIHSPGVYRFSLLSDDGSKLYLDDRLVIDNDGQHPPQQAQGLVALNTGIHRVEVGYYQGPRYGVALVLSVAAPGEEMRVFDVDNFKPPADVEIPVEADELSGKKKRE